jgi:hypothetical protein
LSSAADVILIDKAIAFGLIEPGEFRLNIGMPMAFGHMHLRAPSHEKHYTTYLKNKSQLRKVFQIQNMITSI